MPNNYVIVTNCSARKRGKSPPLRLEENLIGSTLQGTARAWLDAVHRMSDKMKAHEMYAGRAIGDAKVVASHLGARLHIMSAGLGLISATDSVCRYDLTASGNTTGLNRVLNRFEATPALWWRLVCNGQGISSLIASNPSATFLVALPATYLQVAVTDIMDCSSRDLERVRLFTSPAGTRNLPDALKVISMPYDTRLEAVRGYAGTQTDFAQRAMRHFVEHLGAHRLPRDLASVAVEDALKGLKRRKALTRKRCDDQTIKAFLSDKWEVAKGRSSSLLRQLRDEACISCEQGRFSLLWNQVRLERVVS